MSLEIRELIRQMSTANPLWGAPRIHGELLKLGIQISQATVAKCMVRQRKPPSQTWRTFLENLVKQLVAIDFLVVPTVSFRLLFVFKVRKCPGVFVGFVYLDTYVLWISTLVFVLKREYRATLGLTGVSLLAS